MAASNGTGLFWQEFLSRLIGDIQARGGAVWLMDQQRQLHLAATVGLSPSEFFVSTEEQEARLKTLTSVMQQMQAIATDVIAANGGSPSGAAVILSAPVTQSGRLLGIVELVQRSLLPQQLRVGQLQFLQQSCQLADVPSPPPAATAAQVKAAPSQPQGLPARAAVHSAPRAAAVDWPGVMRCLKQLHTCWRLKDVASVIANEGRLLWHADRVSVVVPRGRSVRVIAASGQDKVHHRANLIQTMCTLAKLVMETKEPFQYGSSADDIPPQLETPLAEFVQLSGARYVLIAPLLEPQAFEQPDDDTPQKTQRALLGALVIEQMQQSQPEPALTAQIDLMREHLAAALHQAAWRESIFLLPLWLGLGRLKQWLRGRRLAWCVLILASLIGTTAAMVVVPWEFRIDGRGRLMPVIQRDVFAPWDGQVVELYVAGGDRVSERQPLLLLRNEELQTEYVKSRSELDEKRKLVASYHAQLDDAERNADRNEATRLQGKVAETRIEIAGLTERVAILKDRIDRLLVLSPIHGVITTFQASQLLLQRPVQRGEVLLEVMDNHGQWQLELEVPEHRLGHILAAQSAATPDLPITFRLLTHPEVSYTAQLSNVGTRSVTSEDQGSIVELTAALDSASIAKPSIGAQVRARIGCGRKPLGYCLFGDVIEFVQKYLWW